MQEKVQCVRGERKLNFCNEITEILVLSKLGGVPERENNCGNQITEIVGMREKIWIVATKLLKMKGKKKKEKCYIHNIFTSFSQQITGG